MNDIPLRETEAADMAQNRLLLAELGWRDFNNALILAEAIELRPDELTRPQLIRRMRGLLERLE